jgi:hypothetical protein
MPLAVGAYGVYGRDQRALRHQTIIQNSIHIFPQAMAAQSQLCPVCIQIVQPKNRSAVNAGYVTPEGQSLETFQRAAEQHCFICFSLWNLSERHRIEWANLQPSLWRPLSFSVTKEESDSFMRLSVMYKDPTRNRGELITDVRFRLIRPEGRPSLVNQFVFLCHGP